MIGVNQNGFRRVGVTPFVCYSGDLKHASHKLAIVDDPPYISHEVPEPLASDVMQDQFPVHAAIARKDELDIGETIRKQYEIDHGCIHQRDPVGFTPVLVAALAQNRDALYVLLELGASDDLKRTDNKLGATPLEALEQSMKLYRATNENILGSWEGYPDADLKCQFLLKQASNMSTLASTEMVYVARRKLGCTCGQCSQGWLSRRMRYRLTGNVHSSN